MCHPGPDPGSMCMNNKTYDVYILANKKRGTLYIGVTNNLKRRIFEHKNKEVGSFTKKYSINKLVYYEETNDVVSAITREKQLKNWQRIWKIDLIESVNPEWKNLEL